MTRNMQHYIKIGQVALEFIPDKHCDTRYIHLKTFYLCMQSHIISSTAKTIAAIYREKIYCLSRRKSLDLWLLGGANHPVLFQTICIVSEGM